VLRKWLNCNLSISSFWGERELEFKGIHTVMPLFKRLLLPGMVEQLIQTNP
jgi:hypothetical protein